MMALPMWAFCGMGPEINNIQIHYKYFVFYNKNNVTIVQFYRNYDTNGWIGIWGPS